MRFSKIAGVALGAALLVAGLVAADRVLRHDDALKSSARPVPPKPVAPAAKGETTADEKATVDAADSQGLLYGRVTGGDGTVYEGRLRWGGEQEAFWGDYFNGLKRENPWSPQVPPDQLPKERHSMKVFGVSIITHVRPINLQRLFMTRFGDIVRVEAQGRDVKVTLKSGTTFDLDRFGASDFDDGVRVWDRTRGAVDLDSLQIRSIELLPTPRLDTAPARLHGTVRTPEGEFTGFIQWDREECIGSDMLDGRTDDGDRSLRFDTIRSIARQGPDASLVTLLDGSEVTLSGTNDVGRGNRGVYVDDPRYGRVLVAWDAFKRLDFSPGGSGPAYDRFPPGRPLKGTVVTRDGRHLAGRLVFDLDESETTETLDAPWNGVDYTIPFGLIAAIEPAGADRGADPTRVTLVSGEILKLNRHGDLGGGNAGCLIFADGSEHPEYVTWPDVAQIEFDHPLVVNPPPR